MKLSIKVLIILSLSIVYSIATGAQTAPAPVLQYSASTGTQHGVYSDWTPATAGSDTNAVAGYNVWRCAGAASACPTTNLALWTVLNTAPVVGTQYIDPPSSALVNGSSYTYAVTTVDTIGNQSAFSPTSTVQVPSTGFPSNPSTPPNVATTVH